MVPLFYAKNISKIFPSSTGGEPFVALQDVSIDIYENQCLIIAGSNGSGKTLLMRIIAGLLEPTGGEVLFQGQHIFSPKRSPFPDPRSPIPILRRELGLVFQDADAQIVGETVAEDTAFGPENLGFLAGDVKARVDQALAFLDLSEKRDNYPRSLSGGEKRRLAVAGVLAAGCSIVIMDEPFANLDWPGVVSTLGIISDLKKSGKTLIILTHELEKVLALADRLVILHRGVIRNDGPPADVLDNLDPAWGVRDPRRNYATVEDCTWLEK